MWWLKFRHGRLWHSCFKLTVCSSIFWACWQTPAPYLSQWLWFGSDPRCSETQLELGKVVQRCLILVTLQSKAQRKINCWDHLSPTNPSFVSFPCISHDKQDGHFPHWYSQHWLSSFFRHSLSASLQTPHKQNDRWHDFFPDVLILFALSGQ